MQIDYRNSTFKTFKSKSQFCNCKLCPDTLLSLRANTRHIYRALYNWILPGFVFFIQIDNTVIFHANRLWTISRMRDNLSRRSEKKTFQVSRLLFVDLLGVFLNHRLYNIVLFCSTFHYWSLYYISIYVLHTCIVLFHISLLVFRRSTCWAER